MLEYTDYFLWPSIKSKVLNDIILLKVAHESREKRKYGFDKRGIGATGSLQSKFPDIIIIWSLVDTKKRCCYV